MTRPRPTSHFPYWRAIATALAVTCSCRRAIAPPQSREPGRRFADDAPASAEAVGSASETDKVPPCSQPSAESNLDAPIARDQAIALAEAFVRAAGYTDAPATCFQNESVVRFSRARTLAIRYQELLPGAWAVKRMNDPDGLGSAWGVVFLYDPDGPLERSLADVSLRYYECPADGDGCVPHRRPSGPSPFKVLNV